MRGSERTGLLASRRGSGVIVCRHSAKRDAGRERYGRRGLIGLSAERSNCASLTASPDDLAALTSLFRNPARGGSSRAVGDTGPQSMRVNLEDLFQYGDRSLTALVPPTAEPSSCRKARA